VVKGKFFTLSQDLRAQIGALPGIKAFSFVIEDNVLVSANDQQRIANIRGVDSNYPRVNKLAPFIFDGRSEVHDGTVPTALTGLYLANELGLLHS
jgi:lipoprotein-releasing system permease protein